MRKSTYFWIFIIVFVIPIATYIFFTNMEFYAYISDRDCSRNILNIALSLEKYKQKNGHYPQNLIKLESDFIDKIPECPANKGSFSKFSRFFNGDKDNRTYQDGYNVSKDLNKYWLICQEPYHFKKPVVSNMETAFVLSIIENIQEIDNISFYEDGLYVIKNNGESLIWPDEVKGWGIFDERNTYIHKSEFIWQLKFYVPSKTIHDLSIKFKKGGVVYLKNEIIQKIKNSYSDKNYTFPLMLEFYIGNDPRDEPSESPLYIFYAGKERILWQDIHGERGATGEKPFGFDSWK